MKQKILEALQAKFSGVDAKILDRIAEKLTKTTSKEEDVATAIEGVTIQQVIESYADSRATQASETASKNAIAAYEKKYGLKEGEKTDGDEPANKKNPNNVNKDDDPDGIKAIREKMEALELRLAEAENAKTQSGFNAKLVALLKEKGVRESFYTPAITGRTFKDEDEVTAFAESLSQSFADDEQSVANAQHSSSHNPDTSHGGADDEDPLLKGVQEKTQEMANKSKE